MQDLPTNPTRYKFAIAIWVAFTAVFIALLLYRILVEPTDAIWVGVFAIGSFIGIWRWINAARERRGS